MSPMFGAVALFVVGMLLWIGPAPSRVRDTRPLAYASRIQHRLLTDWKAIWRRRAKQAQQRQQIARFTLALADELAAGLPLAPAVSRAVGDIDCLPHTAMAAESGGDVAEALSRDADTSGSATLRGLAAAWEVSAGSGAGLSRAARSLGSAALQRERIRRDLTGHLAAPRSTARILALLPVVGLVLGNGLGGSPITWLFSTPMGLAVLVAGVVLECLGVLWVRHLVRRVERYL